MGPSPRSAVRPPGITDEFLYAEVFTSEQEPRNRHSVWLHHYNSRQPHTACGDQPPASRLHDSVDNVMTNHT